MTVYVLVAPLCDVTTTLIALFPTFKVFFPVPAIVATPLVDSAVTIVSVTLLATVHVYDVVPLANVGDNVQLVKPKLFKLLSVSFCLVTVTV